MIKGVRPHYGQGPLGYRQDFTRATCMMHVLMFLVFFKCVIFVLLLNRPLRL